MNAHQRTIMVATLVLALTLAQTLVALGHYPPGSAAIGGRGTPVIDGTLADGEWASAGSVDLTIQLGGGHTAPGRLLVMNDGQNLYVALQIDARGVSPAVTFSSFVMEFDNDHDGITRAEGDDVFVANPPSGFFDDFRTYLPPCPSGALCGLLDTDLGGANDGKLAFTQTPMWVTYEVSKPLDSADDAHDFSLHAGDVVGFWMELRTFSPEPPGWADTTYPFFVPSPSLMGDIKIVGLDSSAPVVSAAVAPAPNAAGWNNAPVTVTWSVADPESGIASSTGCATETVSAETAGRMITCTATNNAGLTSSATATVRLDRTGPSILFGGNAGTYQVDETVDISCSASDALSGLASPADCGAIQGPAYAYADGATITRSATDNAGNTASAATRIAVVVNSDGLCRLTRQIVSNAGIANSLCVKLDHGAIGAYQNELRAQSGKALSRPDADRLMTLSDRL